MADTENNRIQKFSPDGGFLTKWGRDKQLFYMPSGVAVDGNGNVYVAENRPIYKPTRLSAYGDISNLDNHRVYKFSSEGVFLAAWGSYGPGDDQFAYPSGLAIDGNGNIYVADTENNRIQKLKTDGVFLTNWGAMGTGDGRFEYPPQGVAVDRNGNVYVISDRIHKFNPDGVFLATWGTGASAGDWQFSCPQGIAVDGRENVYVADTNKNRIKEV